jgi:RNA recognition motif-containing protein
MSLFIGNLTKDVTEQDIETIFGKFGPYRLRLKNGFAFCTYDDINDALDAYNDKEKKILYGRELFVEKTESFYHKLDQEEIRINKSNNRSRAYSYTKSQIACYNCGSFEHIQRECKGNKPYSKCNDSYYNRKEKSYLNKKSSRKDSPKRKISHLIDDTMSRDISEIRNTRKIKFAINDESSLNLNLEEDVINQIKFMDDSINGKDNSEDHIQVPRSERSDMSEIVARLTEQGLI